MADWGAIGSLHNSYPLPSTKDSSFFPADYTSFQYDNIIETVSFGLDSISIAYKCICTYPLAAVYYLTALILGVSVVEYGTAPLTLTYFMRAWDTVNLEYVFWVGSSPSVAPIATIPSMSSASNLVDYNIINTL